MWDTVIHDLRAAFRDPRTRVLHATILTYIAILPFNAFGFAAPVIGFVKWTECAFLAVVLATMHALVTRRLASVRAPALFTFLILHVLGQFLSLVNAVDLRGGYAVALSLTAHAVLVGILVTAVRSEVILRAILVTMGLGALTIVLHSVGVFVAQGGTFQTRTQPSLIGSGIAHVLAYALLLFGAGIAYCFVRQERRASRVVWWLITAAWMFAMLITASKFVQGAFVIFLAGCAILLRGRRLAVAGVAMTAIALFAIQYRIVPILNAVRDVQHAIVLRTDRVRDAREALVVPRARRDIAGEVVATPMIISRTFAVATAPVVTAVTSIVRIAIIPPEAADIAVVPSATMRTVPVGFDVRETPPPSRSIFPLAPAGAEEVLPPAPITIRPPTPPSVVHLDEYSEQNNVQRRWAKVESRSSLDLRFRGLITGGLLGWDHPLIGIGVGQTPHHFDEKSEFVRVKAADPTYAAKLPHAWRRRLFSRAQYPPGVASIYNLLMNAWAETGAIGLGALLGILGTIVVTSVRALWLLRARGGLLAIHIYFPLFLAFIFYHQAIYLFVHPWFWTMLALTYAAARVAVDNNAPAARVVTAS